MKLGILARDLRILVHGVLRLLAITRDRCFVDRVMASIDARSWPRLSGASTKRCACVQISLYARVRRR